MTYLWHYMQADISAAGGNTAADLSISCAPPEQNFDSYWDAYIEVENNGIKGFVTDGTPCYYACYQDNSIKKLGNFSWKYPKTELYGGPDLGGFTPEIHTGDIIRIWAFIDKTDIEKRYAASIWIIEWDDVLITNFSEAPKPGTGITPLWTKQIGTRLL